MTENDRMRIVVIGGGKMGEAIVGGWIRANEGAARAIDAQDILVVDPGDDRRLLLAERYGVACAADISGVEAADVVVLAVKPQVMMAVLEDVSAMPALMRDGVLFVSIAAGLTTARLEGALAPGVRLVRVMPNMPLAIGAGASAVTPGANASQADVSLVADLFGCLGKAVVVEESLMDAVCAVSGSGPAYVAAMIESLRNAGAACGLPPDVAEALAVQTVLGTARLISETGQAPEAVRESICSPGGTTLAALAAMDEAGFEEVFSAGVSAAVRRSKELAQC